MMMTTQNTTIKLSLLFFLCFVTLQSSIFAQVTFFSEDFETNGTGTRYTANSQFIDADGSSEDYFGRVQNVGGVPTYVDITCAPNGILDITNDYVGQSGNFYMAGEDMNDAGGCGSPDATTDFRSVIFTGININGASAITGRILVANGASDGCNTTNSRWDEGDGLKVYTRVDGGAETAVLCFSPAITCGGAASNSNEPLNTDDASSVGGACSGDGTNGTFVNNTFTEYTFSVTPAGTTLDLRVEIASGAGDSEIAFDNVRLEAVTPPQPLPVELVSFDARSNQKDVVLNWATGSEINNDYFQIERSIDGRSFIPIAKITGAGNSADLLTYTHIDTDPINGRNFYRLKQVDFDGKSSLSDIELVTFEAVVANINIYPNPASNQISIEGVTMNENLKISVVDHRGLTLLKDTSNKIDISTIPSGVYMITIENEGSFTVKKFIKI